MEWDSLEITLKSMGFHEKFISIIIDCISSVSYLVLLNGPPFGNFNPLRGLRQEDALTPYSFIIEAEDLSQMILKGERDGAIHNIKTARRAPSISRLWFADDSFIFCKARIEEVREVTDILDDY